MDWNFDKNAEIVYTEEFWYDLTDGGYIKPENLLIDKDQIQKFFEQENLHCDNS